MIMRLEMPMIDASLLSGRLVRWRKMEGEEFSFGDILCEISLEEFAALRGNKSATALSGRGRWGRSGRSRVEVREGKVRLDVAVSTADSGRVRKLVAAEGEVVQVGALLAVVSTSDHGDIGSSGDWASAPPLRTATNTIGATDADDLHPGFD